MQAVRDTIPANVKEHYMEQTKPKVYKAAFQHLMYQ
jgi:hypothetical protein